MNCVLLQFFYGHVLQIMKLVKQRTIWYIKRHDIVIIIYCAANSNFMIKFPSYGHMFNHKT